eukprot:2877591-Rhodomonas_salina.2
MPSERTSVTKFKSSRSTTICPKSFRCRPSFSALAAPGLVLTSRLVCQAREILFGLEQTDYERVGRITKAFEPYSQLWISADDWFKSHDKWLNAPFPSLDPEQMERDLQDWWRNVFKVATCLSSDAMPLADMRCAATRRARPSRSCQSVRRLQSVSRVRSTSSSL